MLTSEKLISTPDREKKQFCLLPIYFSTHVRKRQRINYFTLQLQTLIIIYRSIYRVLYKCYHCRKFIDKRPGSAVTSFLKDSSGFYQSCPSPVSFPQLHHSLRKLTQLHHILIVFVISIINKDRLSVITLAWNVCFKVHR
jgi:hypothetical protein